MEFFNKHRNKLLILIDMAMVVAVDAISYLLLILDYNREGIGRQELLIISFINVIISLIVFYSLSMYKLIWRYAKLKNLFRCFVAVLISTFLGTAFNIITGFPEVVPVSIQLVRAMILVFIMFMSRICYASAYSYYSNKLLSLNSNNDKKKRLMIVGAGELSSMFFDDIGKSIPDVYEPVCVVDDAPEKIGRKICGVEVIGTTDDIPQIAIDYKIDDIIVCIANFSDKDKKRIFKKCYETDCHVSKMAIGINDNVEAKIRKIDIDDLLGRDVIRLEKSDLNSFIGGKVCMVTGGGGSIGSELSRLIAALKPEKLVIVDNYENNAYEIQQELLAKYKDKLNLVVEIASVCDENKMNLVFEKHKPDILYHAAAHKHVPFMEYNPEEAVKNNIFGTLNVARLAMKHYVKKFVLVSTDKAVNPTNVMGATKRCCEMIVQSMNGASDTDFVAVRFGNVLGSNGSVIPLFQKQILNGGPVTVTHPEIIRYFMTIPEAVELLLAAGSMAKGGEIFVLDMGEPVKIYDLAKQIIRLSGFVPEKDIKIKFTGLRPGEKLYEELLMGEEGLKQTAHEKIYIGRPIDIDKEKFFEKLEKLKSIVYNNESEKIVEMLKDIVPTFNHAKNI